MITNLGRPKKYILSLASLAVVLSFQNCGFVTKGEITDESVSTPDAHLVGTFNELPSSSTELPSQKIPVCAMSSDKSVVHYGEIYSLKIQGPAGGNALPSIVNIRTFGTKSNLDGSDTMIDAEGASVAAAYESSELHFSNSGSAPGVYTRYFEVSDNETGQTLCKTSTIVVILTPACDLSVENNYVSLNETVKLHVNTSNLSATQGIPSKTIWSKTKDGNGDSGPLTYDYNSLYTLGPYNEASSVGIYSLRLDVVDSGNNVLCRTNPIGFSIYDSANDPGTMSQGEGGGSTGGGTNYEGSGNSGNSSEGGGNGGGNGGN